MAWVHGLYHGGTLPNPAKKTDNYSPPPWRPRPVIFSPPVTGHFLLSLDLQLMKKIDAIRAQQVDAAYKRGMLRAAEIADSVIAPKSIGYDKGRHHMAGAQHASKKIKEEAERS